MNAPTAAAELKPYPITVDDLAAFVDSGAFDGLPRMELLDGVLYQMSPQTSRHVYAKTELGCRLREALQRTRSPLTMLIEPTIVVEKLSAPEPDIALVSQARVDRFYPAELVKMAVEVSITTVKTDLEYKRTLYAQAGIPEYWVVDVAKRILTQFWLPEDGDYTQFDAIRIGTEVTSRTLAGLSVSTEELLPE